MNAERTKTSKALRAGFIIVLVVGVVLGYGYWHAATHASFHIDLKYLPDPGQKAQSMANAQIRFLNAKGQVLAEGVGDDKANFVHLLHPEVGDCHDVEEAASRSSEGRNAWQKCFARLSTWIPLWAEEVRMVDVTYENRRFNRLPVTVSAYNSEWPLWWIPLPHVGGKPYTYYRTTITVGAGDKDNSR